MLTSSRKGLEFHQMKDVLVFFVLHRMREPDCSKTMLLTTLHGILLKNVSCWWLLSNSLT